MQIELFPEAESSRLEDLSIHQGRIGPIRFAATSTSYPHLCRSLAALTAPKERPDGQMDP